MKTLLAARLVSLATLSPAAEKIQHRERRKKVGR